MARDDDERTWERLVSEALRGSRLSEPPEGTLRRAIALGGRLLDRREGHWLVALLFDSAMQPQPAGVRAAPGAQRRLLYEASRPDGSPLQLDLHLRREPRGTLEVTGQVLPPVERAEVLARVSRVTRRKALGPRGEFVLRGLPSRAGAMRVELALPDGAPLVFPDVPLLAGEDGR